MAVGILTVATVQAGDGVLPAAAATPIAVIAVVVAAFMVNSVARQPGLPLLCAGMAAITLLVGAAIGLSGFTMPHQLGSLLFVPILVGTASSRWSAGILATVIIIVANIVAAMVAGPAA